MELAGNGTLTPRPNGPLNIILHICDMRAFITKATDLSMDLLFGGFRWAMLAAPVVLSFAAPVRAQTAYTVTETTEYSYADVEEQPLLAPEQATVARYGPFRVVANDRVEMTGGVESDTPRLFKAMLAAHPGIAQIDMIDCPGSLDDDANLALARMIRSKGIATNVPAHGSIRSGGVELFLAGTVRKAAPSAEFGVHSWQDSDGMEAKDFAVSDPVHTPYVTFYRDMGLSADQAQAFYDFTNRAAPFDGLHVMSGAEIREFGLLTKG